LRAETVSPAELASIERTAVIVTAYRVVSRAYFHLPIVVVFLLGQGLKVLQVGLCMALYGLVVAAGGRLLAPLRSRLSLAGSLCAGEIVKLAGLGLLLFHVDVWVFVVSQILAGAGFALTAGTDAALASTWRMGTQYRAQESRTQGGMFLMSFAAGAAGAMTYPVWDRLPFVLMMGVTVVAAGLVLATGLPLGEQRGAEAGSSAPRARFRVPGAARFWAAYYAGNRALLLSAYTFLIPLQLVYTIRVPFRWFGLVLGTYTLFGLVAARSSPRVAGAGRAVVYALTAVPMVVGLAFLLVDSMWTACVGLGFLGLAGGFIRPATMISLEPVIAGLPAADRQTFMRGMEGRQGVIQAVLLTLSGISVWWSGNVMSTLLWYITIATCVQLIGALSLAPRLRQGD
jgi:hypothetical protein